MILLYIYVHLLDSLPYRKMCKLVTCRPTSTVSSCKWSEAGYKAFLHIIGLSCFWTGPSIHLPSVRGFSNARPPACLPTTHTHKYSTQFAAMRGFPSKISPVRTHPLVLTQTTRLWQTQCRGIWWLAFEATFMPEDRTHGYQFCRTFPWFLLY